MNWPNLILGYCIIVDHCTFRHFQNKISQTSFAFSPSLGALRALLSLEKKRDVWERGRICVMLDTSYASILTRSPPCKGKTRNSYTLLIPLSFLCCPKVLILIPSCLSALNPADWYSCSGSHKGFVTTGIK